MKGPGEEIFPGKKIKTHYFFLKVMTGYDLSKRRIPVMEMESTNKGPLVVLTSYRME